MHKHEIKVKQATDEERDLSLNVNLKHFDSPLLPPLPPFPLLPPTPPHTHTHTGILVLV